MKIVIFIFGCVVTLISLTVTALLLYGATEEPPK